MSVTAAPLEHEQVLLRRGARSGALTIVAVHSTRRGPSLGGCRMWSYEDEYAALHDVLRLSRAMTFKMAAAGLALGGGKGVVMAPVEGFSARRRRAALLDFADTVEALEGSYITAEDVGTSSRDMTLIAERTQHVCGLSRRRGGSGDPSPATALGVQVAIETCCERVFGSASLAERRVGVIGLGHVGARLARGCAAAGAQLVLSDVDERRQGLVAELGGRWLSPSAVLRADVDVLAPCALGGVLDAEVVASLRCRIVAGAANNQLADESVAELLAQRGILWAPDFVVNAGGVINIAAEQGGYSPARARHGIRGIRDTLWLILEDAQAGSVTPLAAADALVARRLKT